jgi:putative (di)nucleoside polyphosphate hydrolase
MESKDQLPLRIGVGIVLLNSNNHVFVAKRIDNPKKFWQMPQGGIEQNENTLNAAKRELEEETGVTSVKLIKELDEWLIYNLPKNLLGKIWKGRYRGQKQKWFVMRFLGDEKEINIKTTQPEFIEWKWVELDKITEIVVDFKLNLYKEVKKKVKEIIN